MSAQPLNRAVVATCRMHGHLNAARACRCARACVCADTDGVKSTVNLGRKDLQTILSGPRLQV